MKELRDKVAFITGGASGLGLGMAKAFGFANRQIVGHYLKFALVMVAAATVVGSRPRRRATETALCGTAAGSATGPRAG